MTTPHTSTALPVAGTPKNSARCVPFHTNRVTTFSPSETCSSIVQFMSGNAVRIPRSTSCNPRSPGPWPGSGTCSTISSQKNSPADSILPWFKTFSTKSRTMRLLLVIKNKVSCRANEAPYVVTNQGLTVSPANQPPSQQLPPVLLCASAPPREPKNCFPPTHPPNLITQPAFQVISASQTEGLQALPNEGSPPPAESKSIATPPPSCNKRRQQW